MVGHLGAAPSVCRSGGYADGAPRFVGGRYRVTRSPIRTARIAVFLVPDEMVEPRGIAPRSTQCHCVVLLLDDGPEMERAPGLAPGKSGFASRRLDDFGIARFWKWGGRRVLPPLGDLHRIECWLLHHGLRLKVILRPALPRHGPHYECGALLTSATEESEMVLPRGLAPRTSAFAERRAELLHLGS